MLRPDEGTLPLVKTGMVSVVVRVVVSVVVIVTASSSSSAIVGGAISFLKGLSLAFEARVFRGVELPRRLLGEADRVERLRVAAGGGAVLEETDPASDSVGLKYGGGGVILRLR